MTTEQAAGKGGSSSSAMVPGSDQSAAVATFERWLADVPDAGGSGIDGILEQIAAAETADELDAAWRANGLGRYVDTPIVVTGIRKMPSEFTTGLSFFLIVDGAVRATGEKIAATTGSTAVVGQLIRAHAVGLFPLNVIPRLSKRPTEDGYFPMHLEIIKH